MSTKIFISYRRKDSHASAGRLYSDLRSRIGSGSIFFDVNSISVSSVFKEEIKRALDECTAILVVIGQKYATCKNEQGIVKLFNPSDYVRFEIEYALQKGIKIFPVLVDDAEMLKAEDLPDSIRKIAQIHAANIRNERWDDDFTHFFSQLSNTLNLWYSGINQQLTVNHHFPKFLTFVPHADISLVGRAKDIDAITEKLDGSNSIVLLHGMGGIGKTALAIAYIDKNLKQYDHVVWIEQEQNFSSSLLSDRILLQNLGVDYLPEEADFAQQIVMNQLNKVEGKCLMVIDNADESIITFKPFFPKDWHILVISRQDLRFNTTHSLNVLTEEQAVCLFQSYFRSNGPVEVISKIVREVDYHTLSIEILAKTAAAKRHTLPLDKFWEIICRRGLWLDQSVSIETAHNRAQRIEKIFPYLCSVFEIAVLSPYQQRLMQQLAMLPSGFLSFDLLRKVMKIEKDEALAALETALYQLKKDGWLLLNRAKEYKMHRLIQDVVLERFPVQQKDIDPLTRQINSLLYIEPDMHPFVTFKWLPFGQRLITLGNKYNTLLTAELLDNMGIACKYQGNYDQALDYHLKAIDVSENQDPEWPVGLAESYNNIGGVYSVKGQYQEALMFYQKALRIREKMLSRTNPDLAVSHNDLGQCFHQLGDFANAEVNYLKAIEISKAQLPANHPFLGTFYNNLAAVNNDRGEHQTALEYGNKALGIWSQALPANHPSLAASYNNLGNIMKNLGQFNKALVLYQKSIAIKEEILSERHPDLVYAYNNIAFVYQAQRQMNLAKLHFSKALEVANFSLDEHHPVSLMVSHNLQALEQERNTLGCFSKIFFLLMVAVVLFVLQL